MVLHDSFIIVRILSIGVVIHDSLSALIVGKGEITPSHSPHPWHTAAEERHRYTPDSSAGNGAPCRCRCFHLQQTHYICPMLQDRCLLRPAFLPRPSCCQVCLNHPSYLCLFNPFVVMLSSI